MRVRNCSCFIVMAVAVLLISGICSASDGDFQYWSRVGFSFGLNQDWDVSVHEEMRFQNGGSDLYYHHTDVGFVHKNIADWIVLGFNYRNVFTKSSTGVWTEEHRPYMDITFKGKVDKIALSNRSRFEYRDRERKAGAFRYRNITKLTFPIELTCLKLKPYVADEVFINFGAGGYQTNRLYSGFAFDVLGNVKGSVYYLWQTSTSSGARVDFNVLGTAFKILF